MKIERIEAIPIRMSMKKEGYSGQDYPFLAHSFDFAIIRTYLTGDIIGVGEAIAEPWYYGTTLAHNLSLIKLYSKEIIGADPHNFRDLFYRLCRIAGRGAFSSGAALDGIFMSLADALGKAHSVPVYKLLGGHNRKVFPLMTGLYPSSPEEAKDLALQAAQEGYQGIKIKCGLDLERHGWSLSVAYGEIAKIKATLEAVPQDVSVDADANQAWEDAHRVITLTRSHQLEDYPNLALEQPIERQDLLGLRRIAEALHLPIVLDETISSSQHLQQAIAIGAARSRVVIKPARLGGFVPAIRCIEIAESAGLEVSIDTSPYSRIGDTMIAHLATIPSTSSPLEAEGHLWYRHDLVSNGGIRCHRGKAVISDAPGLGLEIDEETINGLRLSDSVITQELL